MKPNDEIFVKLKEMVKANRTLSWVPSEIIDDANKKLKEARALEAASGSRSPLHQPLEETGGTNTPFLSHYYLLLCLFGVS